MAKVEELIKIEIEKANEKLRGLSEERRKLNVYIKAREKFLKEINKTIDGGKQNVGEQQN